MKTKKRMSSSLNLTIILQGSDQQPSVIQTTKICPSRSASKGSNSTMSSSMMLVRMIPGKINLLPQLYATNLNLRKLSTFRINCSQWLCRISIVHTAWITNPRSTTSCWSTAKANLMITVTVKTLKAVSLSNHTRKLDLKSLKRASTSWW